MPQLNQEEYDELMKLLGDQRIQKFQLQAINDNLQGGLTSRNIKSFRNTYIINAQDSLDATYPMYVHFNILNEMIKIVSVKVSFWIDKYRAYSKAAASGGGQTSSSGGGQTSSSVATPSGGGSTSGITGSTTYTNEDVNFSLGSATTRDVYPAYVDLTQWICQEDVSTVSKSCKRIRHKHYMGNHSHTTPDHTHPAHSHTVANHTHTVADHTHDAVYGIFEEDTSPKIKFYLSENEGISYNDKFFGNYDTDKSDLEITSLLTSSGSKLIKFESDLRARLSIQIEIKLDIKAR